MIGPQIPKFETATQASLKFDTATRHNLKINMRHAIGAKRDKIPVLSATKDTRLTDTKSINGGIFISGSDCGVAVCVL